MANTEFTFHPLNESHLLGLVKLFRTVFGKKRTTEYFKLKYLSGNVLDGSFSFVAIKGQKIVGFVGAIPQVYHGEDATYIIAHSCEYQTHPDFQRQGIHKQLIARSNNLLKKNGVHLIYGYLSDVSEASINSSGWEYLRYLHYSVVRTGGFPIQKVKYKITGKSKWGKFQEGLQPGKFEADSKGIIMELINHDLLKYRSFTDNGIFKFGACTFWVKLSEVLHIGKFSCQHFASFETGLNLLIAHCKKHGIDKIVFQVDPASKEFEFLTEYGTDVLPGSRIGIYFLAERFDVSQFRFSYSNFDDF